MKKSRGGYTREAIDAFCRWKIYDSTGNNREEHSLEMYGKLHAKIGSTEYPHGPTDEWKIELDIQDWRHPPPTKVEGDLGL